VRYYRLCPRALLFHQFQDELGECSRVMQDQEGRIIAKRPTASRLIVAGEDRVLDDTIYGKQAVGALGVRTVLTRKRNAAADATGELLQHGRRLETGIPSICRRSIRPAAEPCMNLSGASP
jgi:hypothetical protein